MSINKQTVFFALPLAVLLAGCGAPFDIPTSFEGTWEETEPNDSQEEAEVTGFELNGDDWFELSGTFDNDTDDDYFSLDIHGSVTSFEMVTYREYEGAEQEYTIMFPVSVLNFDDAGELGTQQLLAAAGYGADLDSGTTSIMVKVAAEPADTSGTETFAPYTNGKPYRVLIR